MGDYYPHIAYGLFLLEFPPQLGNHAAKSHHPLLHRLALRGGVTDFAGL